MCRQYYERWDELNQRCIRREFGDVCINDAQCQVRGQAGSGYTYSGGACLNGRCDCDSRYKLTRSSFLTDAEAYQVSNKTLCIHDGIEIERAKGQACGVDPIYNSDDVMAALGPCRAGAFCYQCPDDLELPNFRHSDGLCRNPAFILGAGAQNAPIAPQDCFAIYRANNRTRTNRPQLFSSTQPPRIAGGSGYICAAEGFIMDMLLEHPINRTFHLRLPFFQNF